MQWGRLPKVPLTIPTGPTRIRMPSRSAPAQATAAAPPLGAGADDAEVDLLVVGEAAHRILAGEVAAVGVEEEAGVVRRRPHRALEDPLQRRSHRSHPSVTRTGSSSVAPGRSKGSRAPTGP